MAPILGTTPGNYIPPEVDSRLGRQDSGKNGRGFPVPVLQE